MSRIFTLFAAFCLTLSAFAQSNLVGKWTGKDYRKKPVTFEFTTDGQFKLDYKEFYYQFTGIGPDYLIDEDRDTVKVDFKFIVDSSKQLQEINLVIYNRQTKKPIVMIPGIFKFVNATTLKMCVPVSAIQSYDGEISWRHLDGLRPMDFEWESTYVLTKL